MDLGSLFNMTDTVTLKKVERHQNLEFTSVSVEEDILKEEAVRGLLPMCCHTIEHGRWTTHKFLIENNTVRIGRRVGKADIVVDGPYIEDVQVTLQIFGGRWFVIESGIYNLLSVNGIRRRQAIVDKWSSSLIQIGNIPIIMSIPPKVEYDSEGNQIVVGAPESHVDGYALTSSDGQQAVLDISRTVLLGSSPSCEIKVNSEDFSAVVSSFNGSLYLCPIFNPGEFKVDGQPCQRLHPLKDGSVVEVGGSSISVAAAGSPPQQEAQIPNMLDVEICLLEVDDQHNFGTVLKLPPAGEIINFGRGKENSVCIPSPNVSREHAKAKINTTNLVIQDCYSRNGTYVNDEKIERKTARPGDVIRFGDKSYLVSFTSI